MRLKQNQVEKICHKIEERLREQGLAEFKQAGGKAAEKAKEIFLQNLRQEDAIEEQARRMMDQFQGKIDRGEVDPHKFFLMLKKQIAKEKKFIL